jgi:hypothetical protein
MNVHSDVLKIFGSNDRRLLHCGISIRPWVSASHGCALDARGMSAIPPISTELMRHNKTSLCATSRLVQRSKWQPYSITLVGAAEQSRGNVDVQCLSGLQADGQFELGPRRIGKSAGFSVRPACRSTTTEFDASRPAK